MTIWGMTAALIAGIIAALSTYAVQSINYHNPIRQILTASTLRSSAWTRCASARQILENNQTGRGRILIFQLQGHVSLIFDTVCTFTFEFLSCSRLTYYPILHCSYFSVMLHS